MWLLNLVDAWEYYVLVAVDPRCSGQMLRTEVRV